MVFHVTKNLQKKGHSDLSPNLKHVSIERVADLRTLTIVSPSFVHETVIHAIATVISYN